jgi:hypothetical protein
MLKGLLPMCIFIGIVGVVVSGLDFTNEAVD